MYKSKSTSDSAADMKAKKEALQKQVEGIANGFSQSPENLAELCEFTAKFYNYSLRNTMLIMAQNPGASFVGSFSKFKEIGDEIADKYGETDENGRRPYFGVKKGAKAMSILAPTPITYIQDGKEWVKVSKATSKQKKEADAGLRDVKKEMAFKIVPVFDISDTLIPTKYYPKVFSFGQSSEQAADVCEGLKSYIEDELGCIVDENIDNSIRIKGLCRIDDAKEIRLNTRLEDTMKVSTLSHELGHFLMHRKDNESMIDKLTEQKEVEADIFSIMLTSRFGNETSDARKDHLANSYRAYMSKAGNNKTQNPFNDINVIFSNVNKVFTDTIEGLDKYMFNKQQETQKESDDCEKVPVVVQSM